MMAEKRIKIAENEYWKKPGRIRISRPWRGLPEDRMI
jgi:hypothetical protein